MTARSALGCGMLKNPLRQPKANLRAHFGTTVPFVPATIFFTSIGVVRSSVKMGAGTVFPGRAGEIGAEGGVRLEEPAARRGEVVDPHPVPDRIPVEQHAEHHHLVGRVGPARPCRRRREGLNNGEAGNVKETMAASLRAGGTTLVRGRITA